MYFMEGKVEDKPVQAANVNETVRIPPPHHQQPHQGVDNRSYVPDSITMQHLSGRTTDKNYY